MLYKPLLQEFDTIVYVDEKAAAGGNGTLAAPFKLLTDAIGSIHDKTLFVLGEGRYDHPMGNLSGQEVHFLGQGEKTELVLTTIRPNIISLQNLKLRFFDDDDLEANYCTIKYCALLGRDITNPTSRRLIRAISGELENVSSTAAYRFENFTGKNLYGSFWGVVVSTNSSTEIVWDSRHQYKSDFTKFQGCLFPEPFVPLIDRPEDYSENGQNYLMRGTAIQGHIGVLARSEKQFQGGIYIEPSGEGKLSFNGTVQVTAGGGNSFAGHIKIKPHTFAKVKFTGISAPIKKVYGSLIQDAFVDSGQPNKNFGDATELSTSEATEHANATETFLSWQFTPNTDPFYKADNERQAFLELNIKDEAVVDRELNVFVVQEEWQELAINFENKPEGDWYVKSVVPQKVAGKWVVPLTNLLKTTDKTRPFKVSLQLKTNALMKTWSREGNPELAAKLYYEYAYYPPSLRSERINGSVRVVQHKKISIDGTITVKSTNTTTAIDGKVVIKKNNTTTDFSGSVLVIETDKSFFTGSVKVPTFNGNSSIAGTIEVASPKFRSFKGKVVVPTFNGKGNFNGTITIQADGNASFNGTITVPTFNGNKGISGTIEVERPTTSGIDGKVVVPTFDGNKGISGTVTIPSPIYVSFNGTLHIDKENPTRPPKFPGVVKVLGEKNIKIEGTITVLPNHPRQYVFTTN